MAEASQSSGAWPTKLLAFIAVSAVAVVWVAIITHTDQKPHPFSIPVEMEKLAAIEMENLLEEEEARIAGGNHEAAEIGAASRPLNIRVEQSQNGLSWKDLFAFLGPAWAVIGALMGAGVSWHQAKKQRLHEHTKWLNENRLELYTEFHAACLEFGEMEEYLPIGPRRHGADLQAELARREAAHRAIMKLRNRLEFLADKEVSTAIEALMQRFLRLARLSLEDGNIEYYANEHRRAANSFREARIKARALMLRELNTVN